MQRQAQLPEPLPWYALLIVGHALSGFIAWLLVIRQVYYHRKKGAALALLAINLVILASFGISALTLKIPWESLLGLELTANFLWALSAWLFQRYTLGSAPKRYRLKEWRSWTSPITVAVVLATGLAVLLAIVPVISERLQILYSRDILDKQIVLWDFFVYVPFLLPYGVLVGLWWAGKGRRFSAADVISYLSGAAVFYVILIVTFQLFFFLLFKGQPYDGFEYWPLYPFKTTGMQAVFQKMLQYDQLAFVIAPLLLGSVVRIRDFLGRSLLVFTVICLCLLPLSLSSNEFWSVAQGHIEHAMTSPEPGTRDNALALADTLLARYPENDRWPELALQIARHRYAENNFEDAANLYSTVSTRFSDLPRWSFETDLARSILNSGDFGSGDRQISIGLPLVNHESYLTPNWMALLQVIRFWSGESTKESDILIQLKTLSESDEKIKLTHIPTITELDDAAANLGFRLLILPADGTNAENLLESNIPVILPIYNSFYLMNGMDSSRSVYMGYQYRQLSERLRTKDDEGIRDIFFHEQEGKDTNLQARHIAAQAYLELPFSFMGSDQQSDSAPYMAVVYPETAAQQIASALSESMKELQRKNKGYLAGLIAMNALDAGDPVNAVRWAMTSRRLVDDPSGLYIGYLAERLWETRKKSVRNRLGLEDSFPRLRSVSDFFAQKTTGIFLDEAEKQFAKDLGAGRMSWKFRQEYSDFLDRSDPHDREILIGLARQDIAANPAHRQAWLNLADLYEWNDDIDGILFALEGALAADSWNDEIALLLLYRCIQTERRKQAGELVTGIDPSAVAHNPDYSFCLATLAKWNREIEKAEKLYAKAIEMRRYDPLYHLRYGELLLQEGKKGEAEKALRWAVQIDIENGPIQRAAKSLLGKTSLRRMKTIGRHPGMSD